VPIFAYLPESKISTLVVSRITGPNLAKFLKIVAKLSAFNFRKLKLRPSNRFRNASVQNEVGVANLAPKLVSMVPFFERSEK